MFFNPYAINLNLHCSMWTKGQNHQIISIFMTVLLTVRHGAFIGT